MLLNCGAAEDSWKVPWTARRSNQSILREISPEYSLERLMLKLKFKTLATWCKELTHLKRSWCWERLRAGREGEDRGWDGWMASLTWWTWVWASPRSWWWTGKPGVLQSMWLQRVGQDWVTELNWFHLWGKETHLHMIKGHNYCLWQTPLACRVLSYHSSYLIPQTTEQMV